MYYLLSILVGILPEAAFFTLFFVFTKQLKTKRKLLFAAIFGVYMLLSVFLSYTIWFHVALMTCMWIFLHLFYKAKLIDMFVVTVASGILTLLGIVCYYAIPNYTAALIVNRLSIFAVLFMFRSKWSKLYKVYCSVWDRHEGAKIKSLTVRNVSLIALNVLVYVINICMIVALALPQYN